MVVPDPADLVERYVNKKVQGLSVFPFSLVPEYRDRWIRAGADRIVELGTSRRPRQGFTQERSLFVVD